MDWDLVIIEPSLEVRVARLSLEVARLHRLHQLRTEHDVIVEPVIRKSAELLGRCLVADQALLPDDIAVCAQDLLAVWNEASA